MSAISEVFTDSAIDPIPKAFRYGDLIRGSRIDGRDPATGQYGVTSEEQLQAVFDTLRPTVENEGASVDNIAQVSLYLRHWDDRPLMNPPWVAMFTDETDRPTYKFMPAELPGDQRVAIDFYAVPGERRKNLHIDGVAHTNPIPLAVQIGRYLFSSRVLPYDPATARPAEDVTKQADFLFQHASNLLGQADMSWRDVEQGRAFFVDASQFPLLEERWHAHVGAGAAALHPVRYGAGGSQVMLEFIATRHPQ
jgi:2-iminobutanoate/2-iminopropanoate deaminase